MTLKINVENHYSSKIYTSGSRIAGVVVVCPDTDISFHCVQIALVGTARTRVDTLPLPKIINDVFLILDMPVTETSYPPGQTFSAGKTSQIPFEFIVPHKLHKGPCRTMTDERSHDQHMRLPPTMGSWEKDDMSPTMAQIEYKIIVRVLQKRSKAPKDTIHVSQSIKVLPAFPEDPPLSVNNQDALYTLSRTRTIRRSLLSFQKDRVIIQSYQPKAVVVGFGGHQLPSSQSALTLDLTFDSSSTVSFPPEVTLDNPKLEAQTWYAGTAMKAIPDLGGLRDVAGLRPDLRYSMNVKLPKAETGVVLWHKDSAEQGQKSTTWRSRTMMPIRLPTTHKMFLPTFYNRFIARSYILHVDVCLNGSKTTLSIPLQIASQSLYAQSSEPSIGELPPFEASLI
ncbi:hypothetical protein LZ32DRAFT_600644 [Colletotrichum eremochloae]|nr:hypothetical protein LZ32DRAFT_600644 [Colletotrichum eremochloae]